MNYQLIYQLVKGRKIIKESVVSWEYEGEEKTIKNEAMQFLIEYLDNDPFLEGITSIKIIEVKKQL